jgi:hypothetical protein
MVEWIGLAHAVGLEFDLEYVVALLKALQLASVGVVAVGAVICRVCLAKSCRRR